MNTYSAYGLGLHSALPLPELIPAEVRADVVIKTGAVSHDRVGLTPDYLHNWADGEDVYFFIHDVGTFLIRGGREIIIDLSPSAEEQRVRLFLLGAAMGIILHQRGLMVLHGSAVVINGGAVAFIGGKGQGKSTLAAALHSKGYNYLADDLVVIDISSGTPRVVPAFPQLKLWPDSVLSLGGDPGEWPGLSSRLVKRDCRITCGFSYDSVPLERIYSIGWGAEMEVKQMTPWAAFIHLLAHNYAARFATEILHLTKGEHLKQCTHISNTVPVYYLKRPSALDQLRESAELVEAQYELEEVAV